MTLLSACLLGLLEGLTEFIPVSSTGHLIVASHFLQFRGELVSTFEIFIQLGAILAVIYIYRQRFSALFNFRRKEGSLLNSNEGFSGLNGLLLLAVTTLPALFIGALVHGYIKQHLFNPTTVAAGLVVGGIAILTVEQTIRPPKKSGLDSLRLKDAFLIGLYQCLAMWPGISRSAATILGGMIIGIEKKTATEYSFFAAVPVMLAATTLDLYKSWPSITNADFLVFLAGFIVAFASACLSIKFFLKIVANYSLKPFGWYRILVAPLIFWFIKS